MIVALCVMQLADLDAAHASLQAESAQVTGEQARRCSSLEMALERERQRVHALGRRSGRRLCMKAHYWGLALLISRCVRLLFCRHSRMHSLDGTMQLGIPRCLGFRI